MKNQSLLLTILLFFVHTTFAQDWLPFNIGRTYQYKRIGEIEFYTMQVDSVSDKGSHKEYYFDQKAHNFYQKENYYDSNFGGVFGHKMLLKPKGNIAKFVVTHYPFKSKSEVDTFYIKLSAKVGDTWFFSDSGNVKISLKKKEMQTVFPGEMDSVKLYVTSLNDSIFLSKKYGLIKAKSLDQSLSEMFLQLNSIKELNKGVFLPDLRRFYDFQPGDIFVRSYYYFLCRIYPDMKQYHVDTIMSKKTNMKGDTIWYGVNHYSKPIIVTALSIHSLDYYQESAYTINPLTNQATISWDSFGVKRTKLYQDSLTDWGGQFEYSSEHKYKVGLGNTYFRSIDYSCHSRIYIIELVCWKTSKNESPNFNECIKSIITGVDNKISPTTSLKFYPNPTQNKLSIELSNATNTMDVEVYDMLGNKALIMSFPSSMATLDVSVLPNGLYSMLIRSNGKNYYQKFVKE